MQDDLHIRIPDGGGMEFARFVCPQSCCSAIVQEKKSFMTQEDLEGGGENGQKIGVFEVKPVI